MNKKIKLAIVKWLIGHGKRSIAYKYFYNEAKEFEFEKIDRAVRLLALDMERKMNNKNA